MNKIVRVFPTTGPFSDVHSHLFGHLLEWWDDVSQRPFLRKRAPLDGIIDPCTSSSEQVDSFRLPGPSTNSAGGVLDGSIGEASTAFAT